MKTKLKTRKSITKRFRLTKSGKLMRRKQNARHLRSNKSKKQLRKFKVPTTVSHAIAKKYIQQINI